MKKSKRVLSLLLCLMMMLSLFPTAVLAETGEPAISTSQEANAEQEASADAGISDEQDISVDSENVDESDIPDDSVEDADPDVTEISDEQEAFADLGTVDEFEIPEVPEEDTDPDITEISDEQEASTKSENVDKSETSDVPAENAVLSVMRTSFESETYEGDLVDGTFNVLDVSDEEEEDEEEGIEATDIYAASVESADEIVEVLASSIEEPILLEAATIVGTEDILSDASTLAFTATVVSTKADVVFVVDSTGSMSDEINNVKGNLNSFTQTLDESGVNFRIAVVEYKDITVSGERESTKVLTGEEGKVWFNSAEEVATVLSGIYADGGGDAPETVVDALGAVLNDLEFRNDASKFAILLTDAGYKTNNDYGLSGMSDAIAKLQEAGINTSVISSSSYESTYHDLYTQTDGVFCNIYGDFADELAVLAEHIETVTMPVSLLLTTVPDGRTNAEAKYVLLVQVKAMDEERTADDVSLTLSVPGNFVVTGSLVKTLDAVAPGSTHSVQWNVSVPVLKDDTNYTWSVNADSDDFATGAVIAAQDTFQVVGQDETDYSWVFGVDNYSFLNSYDAFGNAPYYISDEDLALFLSQLKPTEISKVADWYARHDKNFWGKKVTTAQSVLNDRLINNDLSNFGGSCYGMSLTAALYKVGLLDPSKYSDVSGNKADSTHDIAPISAGTNTPLESMINVYHLSQGTDIALRSNTVAEVGEAGFATVASAMWNKATTIGHEGSIEQPFVVSLYSSSGGHAVVCYGAEEGEWNVGGFFGIGATKYTKKLMIADPNYSDGSNTYILLTDDYSKALYFSNQSYNSFGYRDKSLSELNNYDYYDMITNTSHKQIR